MTATTELPRQLKTQQPSEPIVELRDVFCVPAPTKAMPWRCTARR
jgi:hypothetical protein